MKPVQLVKNGDFSSGTSGWLIYTSTNASNVSVSNNIIQISKTSSSSNAGSGAIIYNNTNGFNTTSLYYIRATMKCVSKNTLAACGFSNWAAVSGNKQIYVYTDSWETVDIITSPVSNTNIFVLRAGVSSSPNGTTCCFKNVICIDLTATFSSGNEPTIEECRLMFPDDYYEYNLTNIIYGASLRWLLFQRRMMMTQIPAKYRLLEYVSCNGNSGFDSGIIVGENDSIRVEYELSASSAGDKFIVSTINNTTVGTWVETYSNTQQWYVRFGSTSSKNTTNSTTSGKHYFLIKKNYFAVDGSKILAPSFSSSPTSSLHIGGRCSGTGTDVVKNGFYGYLYDVAIMDSNNNYRFHAIPVERVSDSAVGMLDMMTGKFFVSAEAAFTAGPYKN